MHSEAGFIDKYITDDCTLWANADEAEGLPEIFGYRRKYDHVGKIFRRSGVTGWKHFDTRFAGGCNAIFSSQ